MGRRLVLILAVALSLPATALAGDCEDFSFVPNCLGISPGGNLAYRVTIVCSGGPVASAAVSIRFSVVGDTLLCWCSTVPGPRPRVFDGTTNAQGVATFNITAGGCIEYNLSAIPGPLKFAGEIFMDNIKLQEFGTVSPDAVDAFGRLPTHPSSLWDPAGFCTVGLADGVQHTPPLSSATYDWCTDLNCDDQVGLADATILTPFLSGASSCSGNQGP